MWQDLGELLKSMRDGRTRGTILGADQVIIVRGEEGKKRVLEALSFCDSWVHVGAVIRAFDPKYM